MAKSRLHPQFFHTLLPDFQTQLTIPKDFFLNYIERRSVEENTAELKSNESEKTWKVKMTGRRFTDGWEEFAVANDLQIGDVVVVRYVGDMVFHVSDLGPNYSDTTPSNNNDGKNLFKKRLHPRTQVEFSSNDGDVDDDDDHEEIPRKKRVKNSQEAEAVSSSSSADDSCFVAPVTASNLRTDTLYLPLHFTSSNGLKRKCCKVVLTDGGERSWTLDLRFNESSATFYISQGWRNFCDENSQEAGGFFMFKLVKNGETPVLSFCPKESISDRRQGDCSEASRRETVATKLSSEEENIAGESSEDECSSLESLMEIEKNKYSPKRRGSPYSSYSPCHKRLVTFTLPADYVRIERLTLSMPFLRENGINKPGEIYLLDKDGTKWLTNLLLDKKGRMALGKGWKDFVKANGLETGFTLEVIWEETTPVLSLCCGESNNDRGQKELSKVIEKPRCAPFSSYSPCLKLFVTFKLPPDYVRIGKLCFPAPFLRENGINKPGEVYLLGKDGTKWPTILRRDSKGTMYLGKGWKDFVKANGLKTSFTLKLIWEGTTPVLSLCCGESNNDRGQDEFSKAIEKQFFIDPINTDKIKKAENNIEDSRSSWEREKNHLRWSDSTPSSEKQFVTLTITPFSVHHSRLRLPKIFTRENDISKPGMITLLGKDGKKQQTKLLFDKTRGSMSLGSGWKDFVKENGLKTGDSFKLKLIWEDKTPVLSLFPAECSIDRGTGGGCSETNQKKSLPIQPSSCKNISKDENIKDDNSKEKNNREENNNKEVNSKEESRSMEREKNHMSRRDSITSSQKKFVTLTITPSSVKKTRLILSAQFARENSIEKPGMIYLLDTDGKKWLTNLQRDKKGTMSLGKGWKDFAEANDLNPGESFTMELVWEDTTPEFVPSKV